MSKSFLCSGSIAPSRIVKQDASNTGQVSQAAANSDVTIGVAQAGTHLPNLTVAGVNFDDGFAGTAVAAPPAIGAPVGTDITVYTVGDECMVEIGAAVSNGDELTSDANGRAITASSGQQSVGKAMMSGTALGQLIRCVIEPKKI